MALKVTVTLPWSSGWVFLRGYHRVLVVAYRGSFPVLMNKFNETLYCVPYLQPI